MASAEDRESTWRVEIISSALRNVNGTVRVIIENDSHLQGVKTSFKAPPRQVRERGNSQRPMTAGMREGS
ncbi:hypothetical protein GCM10007207_26160 [Asaia siamensis]|uniref:Uncharacterized protein n=1 Tax=Asaia siamensis TaxID=110479 RepID=A0ABQ1MEE7_9PROT|nr:hypothetical protein AA0323_1559 [Asaia siamensis NRIC 0323]GGC39401.1 hypothetical protein GCM10007207_26160 [Asaia siamensis]